MASSLWLALAALAVALAVAEMPPNMKSYAGSQVLRVTPTTQPQLNMLRHLRKDLTVSLHLDWWEEPSYLGRNADLRVTPESLPIVQRMFENAGLNITVMIPDVQTLVEQQLEEALAASANANPNADFDFTQYHKLDEISAWVQTLPQQFPGLVTVFQVATSYERRPIYAVQVTSNKTSNADKIGFWIDGGIHAREWIAPATVVYILNQLLTQYGKDAQVTKLVDSLVIYVVPVFNVDGYTYTWTNDRMWRKTRSNTGHVCIGVDPNRNWDFHWGEQGASDNPCDDAYYGPKAFSEIEVKTIADYIKSQPSINAYFNFHSYSQLWMSPWGYSAARPKDYDVQMELSKDSVTALTAVHGTRYQYGPIYTTIYPASGSSVDWTYGVANVVFSYGVELRDTGQYGFLLPANQIVPSGEETFAGIKVALQYVLDHPRE